MWFVRDGMMVQLRALAAHMVLALALAASGCATGVPDTVVADPTLRDFQQRVDAYVALHKQAARSAPMQSTTDPSQTDAAQRRLAARLQQARANAQQGDVFTPAIAARLRQLMNPELRGAASANTRGAIRDDAPATFALKVNAVIPGGPLPTMPGNVLRVLPRLPEELEYRIVNGHLVLRDVQANMIVDYIADVM